MNHNFSLRFFSSLLLGPLVIFMIFLESIFFNLLLFIVTVVTLYETFKLKNNVIKVFIFFLLFIFVLSSYQIYNFDNGRHIIIFILLLTWLSDIGGYIFGKLIGGKKIKLISPNKTYSGFFGSFLLVQLFGFCFKNLNLNFVDETLLNFYFLLICTSIVILGDLIFSFFKRKCKIKDFSNFIPGHGGLLDRVDGLIFLTIFIYISRL